MAQNNTAATEELPEVKKVEKKPVTNPVITTVYFENGAKLRYKANDGKIVEEIFAPSDPDSVMDSTVITEGAETTENIAATSLDLYDEYETVGELMQDWGSLAEWITHK